MNRLVYFKPDMPKIEDAFWDDLAKWIADELLDEWANARVGVEQKWEECDAAFLMERTLPEFEGFDYVNQSDKGDPDVRDGVDGLCLRLGLGMMDRRDEWLSLVGRAGEPAAVTKAVKAEQAWMHRASKSRKHFVNGWRQEVVRGINHWFAEWVVEEDLVPLGTEEGRKRLAAIFAAEGADPALVRQIKTIREPKITFNGPRARVVDCFDIYLDPETHIFYDPKPAFIMRRYMRPFELEEAMDSDGEPIYKNLEQLVAQRSGDVYFQSKDHHRRDRSRRIMGMSSTTNSSVYTDVVPVYIYYNRRVDYKGYSLKDCYFYVARSGDGKVKLIRIEENPSINGQHLLITDCFADWFTHQSYGIGMVETVLPAYVRKNFFDAVMDNAMAAQAFPALLIASGALKYNELRMGPGQINEISAHMMGTPFLQTVPTPTQGIQMNMQHSNYLKSSIQGSFEVSGTYGGQSDPQGDRKTATEVNYKASSQGLAIDEYHERLSPSLQRYCQWAYDTKQAVTQPEIKENGDKVIPYNEVNAKGVIIPREMLFEDWKQPRTIEILGSKGVLTSEKNKMDLIESMKAFGQMAAFVPNAPTLGQALIQHFYKELEIETPPEAWQSALEIAASNPQVIMMAAQEILNNPDMAAQLLEQMGGQNEQAGQPNQPPNPQNPGA